MPGISPTNPPPENEIVSFTGPGCGNQCQQPLIATTKLSGLPNDRNTVKTYGDGGGKPTYIKTGPFKGLNIGGGTRDQVFSTDPPVSNTSLPWGFLPLDPTPLGTSTVNPYLYYGLPQNITRPGGDVYEMTITPKSNVTPPFFFVSDEYSAGQVEYAINTNCSLLATASDPIPFNSTGNIQLGNVVQLYRGDSAAILLRGYNTAGPPLLQSIDTVTWTCLNLTIGESIPLVDSVNAPPLWAIAFIAIPLAIGFVILHRCQLLTVPCTLG